MKDLITDENILQVLKDFINGGIPIKFPKILRSLSNAFAYYEAKLGFEHTEIRRHIILTGSRRVGKSTIMYQTINDLLENGIQSRNIVYVSFDHPILKMSHMDRIIKVFINNIALNENIFLFLDEIQYATDWNGWLKTIYDNNPGYRVMATGSASPVLNEKMPESGVGRWTQIKIPTLSFYEYLELKGIKTPAIDTNIGPTSLINLDVTDLKKLMSILQPLEKHFHRYLLIGGFPEIAQTDDISYAQKIIREDVVDKVLKRDMVSLFNVRNIDELERIFLYLCMTSSSIVEASTISSNMGIARPTVTKYLSLLELANLIYLAYPVEMTGKKILKAKPKVYLADSAIRNAVLVQGEDVIQDPEQMGMIVESAIYKHIQTFYYNMNPKIGYFRDSSTQKEIELSFLCLEVRY